MNVEPVIVSALVKDDRSRLVKSPSGSLWAVTSLMGAPGASSKNEVMVELDCFNRELWQRLAAGGPEDVPKRTGNDRRREVVDDIAKLVCRDRQGTYGDAEDNFTDIAAHINTVLQDKLKTPLDRLDVAIISVCIKLGRLRHSRDHLDSWIDVGGYATCGAGIVKCDQEKLT